MIFLDLKVISMSIEWLNSAGITLQCRKVSVPDIPLKAYEDLKAFKMYMLDVGLLGCMAGLGQRVLIDGSDVFTEFKGALTEQYVCQQLKTLSGIDIYYYTNDRGSCEIDFVISDGSRVIPVEVKAEINLRAKSLKTYMEKFSPEISLRISMADFKESDGLTDVPLYAVECVREIVEE